MNYYNNQKRSQTKEENSERINIIIILLGLCFLIIIFRLLDLTLTSTYDFLHISNHRASKAFYFKRGDVVDRNGVVLATNIPTISLYVHPKRVLNPQKTAQELSKIIPDINSTRLLEKLNSTKSFLWVKKHLAPHLKQEIEALGLPGLGIIQDEKRFYPMNNIASHVVGYVDAEENGVLGIERAFNVQLSDGAEIKTTLDIRVQYIIENELRHAIEAQKAKGGVAILMKADSGEIISMVSLPDFNPNYQVDNDNLERYFNQATLGVQEMGSTMKAFSLAVAIDTGKVSINDVFDVSKPIKTHSFVIRDYRGGKGGSLSVPEIFMYSSNIGTAKITEKTGLYYQKDYLRRSGALGMIDFDLLEKSRPLYPSEKRWNETSMYTISYGHGLAITPLHAAQIFAMIVNGGWLNKPLIIQNKNLSDDFERKPILKKATSDVMRRLLWLVTTKGYSSKANVEGYGVGGKTGTAEKIVNGRYVKNSKNVTIFLSAFPINKPEYVLFLSIDEPQANALNRGFTTGGWVAAPVGGVMIAKIGQVLGVEMQSKEAINKAMHLNYKAMYMPTK